MKNDKSRFVVGASDFYLSLFICHFSFDGKSFAFCKGFLCVLLGAHASCLPGIRNSEHAGSVRSQGRPPRSPRLYGEILLIGLPCTTKRKILCKLPGIFLREAPGSARILRAGCWTPRARWKLEACAPRDD